MQMFDHVCWNGVVEHNLISKRKIKDDYENILSNLYRFRVKITKDMSNIWAVVSI